MSISKLLAFKPRLNFRTFSLKILSAHQKSVLALSLFQMSINPEAKRHHNLFSNLKFQAIKENSIEVSQIYRSILKWFGRLTEKL